MLEIVCIYLYCRYWCKKILYTYRYVIINKWLYAYSTNTFAQMYTSLPSPSLTWNLNMIVYKFGISYSGVPPFSGGLWSCLLGFMEIQVAHPPKCHPPSYEGPKFPERGWHCGVGTLGFPWWFLSAFLFFNSTKSLWVPRSPQCHRRKGCAPPWDHPDAEFWMTKMCRLEVV